MSNFDGTITSDPAWVDVPQLSAACKALGGPGGPMNAQAVAIVSRLGFLAGAIDALNAGSALHTGDGEPGDELGENGDLYIDPVGGALYGPKAAGVWPAANSLIGPPGSPGTPGVGIPGPAGSGALLSVAVYDAAGTYAWPVPAGVTTVVAETWAPGGGGSRVAAPDGSGNYFKGSGGGGGAYIKAICPVTPGQILQITVGAKGIGAGVGAQSASDSGGDGGTSQVLITGGWFVFANGGGGATGLTTGGTGGTVSSGAGLAGINVAVVEAINGQRGQDALLAAAASSANPDYYSGNGGAGAKGGSGGWGRRSISSSSGDISNAGVFPGGGGAGADEAGYGGPGADGKVVIWY